MQHAPPGGGQQNDAASALQPGTCLGNFQITEYVAAGGMGFIYRGWQPALQRVVAIKVMREQLRRDDAAVKRFQREARTISQLHHANTISIIDFGTSEQGFLYIVMEWLEGADLGEHIKLRGPIDPMQVIRVAIDVANSLGEAHEKGIIHRDLKPENIFLAEVGEALPRVKVLDFGIAKIVDGPAQTQITRMGMVCGTPDFMSPEQARGEDLDGRSDVYALGCVIYTMLTGQMPLPADSPVGVVMRHQLDAFPHLPEWMPEGLDEIVQRATLKKRDARFASADQMAAALHSFGTRFNPDAWEDDLADAGGATMPMPPLVFHAPEPDQPIAEGETVTLDVSAVNDRPTELRPALPMPPPRPRPMVPPARTMAAASSGIPGWLIGFLVAVFVIIVGGVAAYLLLSKPHRSPTPVTESAPDDEPDGEEAETVGLATDLTTVVLTSKPDGATILGPDGELIGRAPQTIRSDAEIDAVYSAKLDGYVVLKRWVQADAGTHTSLVLELEKQPSVLCVINSQPKGAEVVDGDKVLGVTPLLVEVEQNGTREVQVQNARYKSEVISMHGAKPCDVEIKLRSER